MLKILITGGAGYLGNILVERLLLNNLLMSNGTNELVVNGYGILDEPRFHINEKLKITVLDNLLFKQTNLTEYCYRDDFGFIYGDVRNNELMKKLINSHDIIIPLAAIVGMPACNKSPNETKQINQEVIEFIAKESSSSHRIIFPTTNSGYGLGTSNDLGLMYCTEETELNPISLYGVTKVNAEKVLLDKGNAVTLRLATAFGISPRMRLDILVNDFTYRAFTDKYIVLFESHFKRNFIHVKDVARTFVFTINNFNEMLGKPYNVGLSNANLSKLELCEKIKEQIPNFFITESEINKDPDKRNYIVSNKKLESLGWYTNHTLESGIKELIRAYSIISNNNKQFTNL